MTNAVPKLGSINNRKRKAASSLEKTTSQQETERTEIEEDIDHNKTLIGRPKEQTQEEEKIQGENCEEDKGDDDAENAESSSKTKESKKRKRKTKEEKTKEEMPLAARSVGLRFIIGAHVSVAKGEFCFYHLNSVVMAWMYVLCVQIACLPFIYAVQCRVVITRIENLKIQELKTPFSQL